MKAVFLDRATFSAQITLPTPDGISDYQVYDATPNDTAAIIERCQDADIIITNKVLITRDVISALPKLKLIQLTATGMNNVDKTACDEHGVQLYNVAGYSVASVPEHTFGLMLSAMRALNHYHRVATDGTWQADGRFCLLDEPIYDLQGRTLGIIGSGNIGRRVGEIARVFGMTVLYAERQGKSPRSADYTDFDTVLADSDIISLHCPLTDDTLRLINDNTIAKMTKRPLIVNVARGAVVDGDSIVKALNQQQILGYASDVFDDEPFANDDALLGIKDHPRVLFTPHNAWGSLGAQAKLWQILSRQVSTFIRQSA
ncbi:D-2-hydroxyacid dehydrogenase [uncultured Moraxella sp.]|uniref:D-2-hydroxyacid dehydrogenase n=1 Tax=uncultured Moraxella sp. TaxID=263769 RepID=UPI0025FEB308|nr:D-2-hydroxyacid dehydrogenase [uncultured Moraxella sp.]